ncbi:MAG: helix-turn-helix domain-containing protein [Muribaculaceae bacterium]|nr:helix-turn-helix domain-containing protein [Muribaculaceae bacterium]MDE6462293.1 helix-turn-helix domain-containing protein [Muribaculaceae bacterium]MDE6509755.1 helix-turn-helix domain-containing protein [Muribaculaceae bacterium]
MTLQIASKILHDLNASSTLLLVIASCLLWLKPERGRTQTVLAIVMSIWSIPYIAGMTGHLFNFHIARMGGVLPVPYLAGGTFYMILLLLLPCDMVRPGWMTLRRTIILMLPFAITGSFYYAVTAMLGQTIEPIDTYEELWMRRSEFCVWFRLVILATSIFYIILSYHYVTRELPTYITRCNEEFGDGPDCGLIWIRIYAIWCAIILTSYGLVVFIGQTWTEVIHTIILQIFFVFIFFKSWNYVTPYSECEIKNNAAPRHSQNDDADCCGYCEQPAEEAAAPDTVRTDDEHQFDDKIAEYSRQVSEWFEAEKPYLNPDFKLIDVMAVLPLNRTYLSRVFNEGFGENFSAVVRGYRLRYAERLLTENPSLSIVEVARQSGFSSNSVFHRAFLAYKGVTPVQFRKN